jgi:hypothetical protein
MSNDEAKQRAKNYMRLKGALEPKQIKCDCGLQEERKQTAIEYLVEKLNQCEPFYSSVLSLNHKHHIDGLIEQAKQMEKEQIIDACIYGPFEDLAEDFYNKTYG